VVGCVRVCIYMCACLYLYVCVFVFVCAQGDLGKEFEQERKTRDEMDKIFKQVTATMITKKTTNKRDICTHTSIYIHINIYIFVSIQTYVCVYIFMYVCV